MDDSAASSATLAQHMAPPAEILGGNSHGNNAGQPYASDLPFGFGSRFNSVSSVNELWDPAHHDGRGHRSRLFSSASYASINSGMFVPSSPPRSEFHNAPNAHRTSHELSTTASVEVDATYGTQAPMSSTRLRLDSHIEGPSVYAAELQSTSITTEEGEPATVVTESLSNASRHEYVENDTSAEYLEDKDEENSKRKRLDSHASLASMYSACKMLDDEKILNDISDTEGAETSISRRGSVSAPALPGTNNTHTRSGSIDGFASIPPHYSTGTTNAYPRRRARTYSYGGFLESDTPTDDSSSSSDEESEHETQVDTNDTTARRVRRRRGTTFGEDDFKHTSHRSKLTISREAVGTEGIASLIAASIAAPSPVVPTTTHEGRLTTTSLRQGMPHAHSGSHVKPAKRSQRPRSATQELDSLAELSSSMRNMPNEYEMDMTTQRTMTKRGGRDRADSTSSFSSSRGRRIRKTAKAAAAAANQDDDFSIESSRSRSRNTSKGRGASVRGATVRKGRAAVTHAAPSSAGGANMGNGTAGNKPPGNYLDPELVANSLAKAAVPHKLEHIMRLKRWVYDHWDHPYPSPEEKQELLKQLSGAFNATQLKDWFRNERKRYWRPYQQNNVAVWEQHDPAKRRATNAAKRAAAAAANANNEGGRSGTKKRARTTTTRAAEAASSSEIVETDGTYRYSYPNIARTTARTAALAAHRSDTSGTVQPGTVNNSDIAAATTHASPSAWAQSPLQQKQAPSQQQHQHQQHQQQQKPGGGVQQQQPHKHPKQSQSGGPQEPTLVQKHGTYKNTQPNMTEKGSMKSNGSSYMDTRAQSPMVHRVDTSNATPSKSTKTSKSQTAAEAQKQVRNRTGCDDMDGIMRNGTLTFAALEEVADGTLFTACAESGCHQLPADSRRRVKRDLFARLTRRQREHGASAVEDLRQLVLKIREVRSRTRHPHCPPAWALDEAREALYAHTGIQRANAKGKGTTGAVVAPLSR